MNLCRTQRLALVLAFVSLLSQAGRAAEPVDDARAAIAAQSEKYARAYNAKDAVALANCWAEKAVYTLPDTGEKLVGRQAIHQMFAEKFASGEKDQLSIVIDDVRLVTDTVAIETGHASLKSSDGVVSTSKYTAVQVKVNDQWLLDSVNDVEVQVRKLEASPLSSLGWMVGDWIDVADDAQVETSVRWTKNERFLTRNFHVHGSGSDPLEGTQIVGYDPVEGVVRSWVYDSDGGFSEGTWTQKGKNWIVESVGYLADGQVATSIQIYEPIDGNSFLWQSFGRRVGGQELPAISPVKVVRKVTEAQGK